MNLSGKASFVVLVGAVFVAAILDRLWIAPAFPSVANLLLVKPGLVIFGAPVLADSMLGVLSLVVIPLTVLAIAVVPFTALRNRSAWTNAWERWWGIAMLVLLLPAFMLLGGFLYGLVKSSLPGPITAFAESFGFKPTLYWGSKDFALIGPLDGSLAGLLGLAIGFWLIQRKLRKKPSTTSSFYRAA